MNNETAHYPAVPPDADQMSLVVIPMTILRNWRVIAVLPVLLALIVGLWSITRERTYEASASFMPQATDGRGTGGAAALAQQFGVSLGTERSSQSPQFYLDLLRSRTLLRKAVEAEYQIPSEGGQIWRGTLVQYWDLDDRGSSLPPWRQATELLKKDISAAVGRETGIVQFTVASAHPVLAEEIAVTLLELMNDFNLEVRQSRAQEEGRFIIGRMTEAQAELLTAENALQAFLQQNREFRNSPELLFEHDRLQRQVLMRQEVYTSLLRSHEQVRIDAVRDIPLFTVIDHPAGTAEPQGRRTVQRVVVAFMLGFTLAILVVGIREFDRRSREEEDPHYREFQSLARDVWQDLRHPARWMRRGEKALPLGDG
jgi:uncharacterized protein involved in exopolysaccharide biosynthesis